MSQFGTQGRLEINKMVEITNSLFRDGSMNAIYYGLN
jgi:hypothetical protein